jgi:hypothetical protein
MMRTHLRDEFGLLLRIGAVDEAQLGEANRRGREASFVGGPLEVGPPGFGCVSRRACRLFGRRR